MKLPLKALAAFVASPQGRRMLKQARSRIDTPENRRRLGDAVGRARTARPGTARPGTGRP